MIFKWLFNLNGFLIVFNGFLKWFLNGLAIFKWFLNGFLMAF